MTRYLKHILIAFLIFLGEYSYSQHYQFTQFYASQTYLNPAFTGANACSRVSLIYRDQWPAVPGTFVSQQFAYDHYIRKLNSGVGLQVFTDKAGSGNLKTIQISGLYAYDFQITKKIVGRLGLSAGYVQRSIDYGSLIFADQIARGGASSSVEAINYNKSYADFGSGALFYSERWWAGFACTHLNTPNQALILDNSRLPREYKAHGGYKFFIKKNDATKSKTQKIDNYFTAAVNYKHQLKFNQLDVGVYYTKSIMVFGLWYRGIPLYKTYGNNTDKDAAAILVGCVLDRFNIGYSYDLTISRLSYKSGGSHEISLVFQFCDPKKNRRKPIMVACPKF